MAVGKRLTWPLRRLLDPRFADLSQRVWNARVALEEEAVRTRTTVSENVDAVVGGYAASSVESLSHVGRDLRGLETSIMDLAAGLEARADDLGQVRATTMIDAAVGGEVSELDGALARVLNYAESHEGFAAQRGLWLNPPISLRHHQGGVEVGDVNERILEVPFAFRALGRVAPGARVLDFGAAESSVALSLAALGYRVTALDLRPYPFTHPNLTAVAGPLEQWQVPDRSFDAILSISTVEHVGLGWYGEPAAQDTHADHAAMARLAELLVDDGVLALTLPYGTAGVTAVERTYDAESLDRLLDGWTVLERGVWTQPSPGVWSPAGEAVDGLAVAMVLAQPAR